MTKEQGSPWDSEDRDSFRAYLQTKAGSRIIPALVEAVPGLLGTGATNDILIRSGEVRGANTIIQTLLTLAHPPVAETDSTPRSYPSLIDDDAWNDGQKIGTPK